MGRDRRYQPLFFRLILSSFVFRGYKMGAIKVSWYSLLFFRVSLGCLCFCIAVKDKRIHKLLNQKSVPYAYVWFFLF